MQYQRTTRQSAGQVACACERCGITIYEYPSHIRRHIFCSRACAFPGLVERTCEQCGAQFTTKPSRIAKGFGRFCSRECARADHRVELTCRQCGALFTARAAEANQRLFCGQGCAVMASRRFTDTAHLRRREITRRYVERKRGGYAPKHTGSERYADLTLAQVQGLSLDAFAELLFTRGVYQIDPMSGEVSRDGAVLRAHKNMHTGYWHVSLHLAPFRVQTITLHRLLAIREWGADAIKRKHVAHLNGDKDRNTISNLAPMTPKEHRAHDMRVLGQREHWHLAPDQVRAIYVGFYTEGRSVATLGREYRRTPAHIRDILAGRVWKHIVEPLQRERQPYLIPPPSSST
jgi:hypothetical protein